MTIDTNITQDLYVDHTEDVLNGNGTPCVRFVIQYKGERYLADFSPDDENSDTSIIEMVGSATYFSELNNLIKNTHRDQFQIWFGEHNNQ